MAGWGDSGSQTGSKIAPCGGFLCGFNIVGHFMRRARQWACAHNAPLFPVGEGDRPRLEKKRTRLIVISWGTVGNQCC